jgi:hypothetical protein
MNRKPLALAALLLTGAAQRVSAQDSSTNPELAKLQAEKAQIELQTQVYAAAKAKSEAEAAAATAKLGPLSSYSNDGSIDAGENSGKLQATLLAAEATRQSAGLIVHDLCTLMKQENATSACGDQGAGLPKLLVYAESDKPNFDAYQAFELERSAIQKDLERASKLSPAGGGRATAGTFGPGAAVLLSAAGNLLRSDYKLSNLDLTQSDTILIRAFLQQAKAQKLHTTIIVPGLYAAPLDLGSNPAITNLNNMEALRDQVAGSADRFRHQAAKKPKNKDELDKIVATMDAAVARFDAFSKKLSTPDDAGRVPLANVARQAELLQDMGDNSRLLLLKAEYAGGSTYSRKNFWTFLGGIPFYVSGGSLVGYTLFDAQTGAAIYSSSLPQSSVYSRIDDATRRFAYPPCVINANDANASIPQPRPQLGAALKQRQAATAGSCP